MTRQKAEKLLTVDINTLSIEQLQQYRVSILDAWRESQAEYGYNEAVKKGFYVILASESASGYYPVNIWLTKNLNDRFLEVEKRLNELY